MSFEKSITLGRNNHTFITTVITILNYRGGAKSKKVEKVDVFWGRFWKFNAGNLLFRPKNQGCFLQNSVDAAFLEVLTSLELLDRGSIMMALTCRYFQVKKKEKS